MLEIINVTKKFDLRTGILSREQLTAVDGISFKILESETVGLVGESGCGKSTLGKCILKLINIDKGTIKFEDGIISHLSEKEFRPYRKKIQMVFQNPLASFNPLFTIRQSINDALNLDRTYSGKTEKYDKVNDLLNKVRLPQDFAEKRPHELSGGQLQRVGLARALASNPQFIFLDEPTSALDMSIRGQIVNLLLDLQEVYKVSFLFVTHDLRVIYFVADRVLVMYLGQIVETGSRDMIFHFPLHPYTHGLLAATLIGHDKEQTTRYISQLSGEVIQPYSEGCGCKLFQRCGFATEECREPQVLREITESHWVRCWKAEELQIKTKTFRLSL